MAELGFEVVLRPDLRLLVDRLDESIENEVCELHETAERKIEKVVNYG